MPELKSGIFLNANKYNNMSFKTLHQITFNFFE